MVAGIQVRSCGRDSSSYANGGLSRGDVCGGFVSNGRFVYGRECLLLNAIQALFGVLARKQSSVGVEAFGQYKLNINGSEQTQQNKGSRTNQVHQEREASRFNGISPPHHHMHNCAKNATAQVLLQAAGVVGEQAPAPR